MEIWTIYYDKLLMGALDTPASYTIDDVPKRYKAQCTAKANADLEAGVLPQWQYDKMMNKVN